MTVKFETKSGKNNQNNKKKKTMMTPGQTKEFNTHNNDLEKIMYS